MKISNELEAKIVQAISARFKEGSVQRITIKQLEVSEETGEIKIVVEFETQADATTLADGYFGLTSSVRKALGSDWRNYFPVITPVIGERAHA